jgi:hypothetical protein
MRCAVRRGGTRVTDWHGSRVTMDSGSDVVVGRCLGCATP